MTTTSQTALLLQVKRIAPRRDPTPGEAMVPPFWDRYVAMVEYLIDTYGSAQATWRNQHGASGLRSQSVAPCGTDAAYRRHRRRGEQADAECRAAHARYVHDREYRVVEDEGLDAEMEQLMAKTGWWSGAHSFTY